MAVRNCSVRNCSVDLTDRFITHNTVKMNSIKSIVLLALTSLIIGCSFVQSVNKLGKDVYIPIKDDWEGTWVAEDGALQLKIIDQAHGEIEIMFIEDGKLLKYKVFLTKNGDDNTYMNVIGRKEEKYYHFAKFKKDNNLTIVWHISTEALKEAIIKKNLNGNIINNKYGDTILINATKKELNKFFINNRRQMLFEYENPLILRRLTN